MHFHLPKPMHGWREFLGEVGIIVVGVLIALTAEQLVEMFHWQHQVSEAHEALGYELADSIGEGYERQHVYNCIEHRLDEIAAVTDKAAVGGRLPPIGSLAAPPLRTWQNSTWQTTIAGQTASHFNRRDLSHYGTIYSLIDAVQELAPRELSVWGRLNSIVGPGRPITREEITDLRHNITEARLLNGLTTGGGILIRRNVEAAGIGYAASVTRGYASTPPSDFAICRPIEAEPPAHYGSAPLTSDFLHSLLTAPVMLPN